MNDAQYMSDLKAGQEYQDFIARYFAQELGFVISNYASKKYQLQYGESVHGIEIKHDRRFNDTGNLFIETACNPRRRATFSPGGIYQGKHWLYLIGDYERAWTFGTRFLVKLHKAGRYQVHEGDTMHGYLLPIADADKYCIRKDEWHRKEYP